ncbi:hypothetical protein ACJX0J_033149, partial [Zea mays]
GGSAPSPPPHLPGHGSPRQRWPPGDIPHPYATSLFPRRDGILDAKRSSSIFGDNLVPSLPPLHPPPTTITPPSGPTAPCPAGGRFCSANSSSSSWTCPTIDGAPVRNHSLMLLLGVRTDVIRFDLSPRVSSV